MRVHEAAIWSMLAAQGMVENPDTLAGFDVQAQLQQAAGAQANRVFDLRSRVAVGTPPLHMLDHAQAFTRVWKGFTKIGRRVDASGKSCIVRAPADGLLFMPNRQQVRHATDDAFFVIRPIWRRFMWLSAWLRSNPSAQRLLRALPGVYEESPADPTQPITLRVDHAVAALMARDIFHLFGYRVITNSPTVYRRFWRRALLVLWVFPRVFMRLLLNRHREKNKVWIVRQHRFDVHARVNR